MQPWQINLIEESGYLRLASALLWELFESCQDVAKEVL
jgi:hypothetical protein